MDLANDLLRRLGFMFYVMDPRDHLYEKVSDVPDYYKEVTPAFIFVIILEQVLHLIRGKKLMRLNDSVTNISQGILVELFKIPLYGAELILYTWIYNNWRIGTLPWNSPWPWILCMVLTDFFFYWMHRITHQVSIMWWFHEPHHSSEEFNLTVPLRLSVFTSSALWLTYLPMAFFIPPSTFLVHYQLNIIFQYWLHSEYVPQLGILEYVFVTPSHHRVHHGRNRRCIDKISEVSSFCGIVYSAHSNQKETKKLLLEQITYRLYGRNSVQWMALEQIISCIQGPGWSPGTPWLGHLEDIPEPKDDEPKYDPKLPRWLELYVILHAAVMVTGYLQMIMFLSVSTSITHLPKNLPL
ncbi:Alkylglycerol monooxygenase [Araneus ventricosus]|uniref:Alkylglycerol monooxygenase n=1 Tax=Araneus ventricosus TaxID=182803 RepID=A0A4Y2CD69_ARAVE|nr:Alkylglycerol monooxygenase [Araneus ventricosus]